MHGTTYYCIEPRSSKAGDVFKADIVKRSGDEPPELVWSSRWRHSLHEAIQLARDYLSLSAPPRGAKEKAA